MITFDTRWMKFRVWDAVEREMYDMGNISEWQTNTVFDCVQYTPLQWTGFKDINNIDIYEGDILLLNIMNEWVQLVDDKIVVEWHNGGFNVHKTNKGDTYEVIGNIFENPELMEKNDE
jgi:hypothetical protein